MSDYYLASKKAPMNEYFLPSDGVDAEVLAESITTLLGSEATSQPSEYNGMRGYRVKSTTPMTSDMLDAIKKETQERRQRERPGIVALSNQPTSMRSSLLSFPVSDSSRPTHDFPHGGGLGGPSKDDIFQRIQVFSGSKNQWIPTTALLDRASFGADGNLISEHFLRDVQVGHSGSQTFLNGTAGRSVSPGRVILKFQATEEGVLEKGLMFVESFRVAGGLQHFDLLLGRSFLQKAEGGSTHFTYQSSSRKSTLSGADRAEIERRQREREQLQRERESTGYSYERQYPGRSYGEYSDERVAEYRRPNSYDRR